MEKKIIQVNIQEGLEKLDRNEIKIDLLLDWLIKSKEQNATHVEIWTTYGWEDKEIDFNAYYSYEESDEQAQDRINREAAYRQQQKENKIAERKALYLKLKEEFES